MARKATAATLITGLLLALAVVLAPARQASAQQGITWTTGFQIQNLGTTAANVSIDLINQDGTTAATVADERIEVNSSKTYFPVPANAGFKGSAVISSDQPVAAILNILGNSGLSGQPYYSASAPGITEGATSVNLPLIQRGNSGFNTWFAVQNAGTTTASVTVAFSAGLAGTSYTTQPQNVAPGASLIFDQEGDAGLGTRFVGSATVTSSQPLAVVVNQVGKGNTKTQLTYSGFPRGTNSVVLPLVQQANATFFSGISIQNVGTVPADVTLTYGPNTVGTGAPANQTVTLQPGASQVYLVDGTARYVGSAVVTTAAANQQVVVVVNQLSPRGLGTAYEGIASSTATTRVSLPLLMDRNAGFFTGVQCRNVGTATATITLTYSANTVAGSTLTPAAVSASVDAGSSVTWLQNNIGQRYIGSGTVTTDPASPVVCIVNELNTGQISGDAFLTYNGINY